MESFCVLFSRKGTQLQDLKDWVKTHGLVTPVPLSVLFSALWPHGWTREWTVSRPLFKAFFSFLVKECGYHVESSGGLEGLLGSIRHDNFIEQAREELEVIDFFVSLGYNFNAPVPFYMWQYNSDTLYSSLCVRSHARILDAGAIVPMRWKYDQLHFGASFIYSMWEARQEYKQSCMTLMGILRIKRPDLRRLVARELISAIGQMVWAHRWDEFSLQ